jgi:penicillin-binding protein 2
LQEYVLARLQEVVAACTVPSGAAVAVIDVPSREVRALVSFPTYNYEQYNSEYVPLRRDTRDLPLMSRAVAAEYPPGSICKAIALVGALSEGLITPQTKIECTGHLLPDKPDQFRCWIYNQHPGVTHGPQDAESAVRNSCNIYFFTVGQMLGPARLCQWFDRFGLGRAAGTGLVEESAGILPTEEWLLRTARRRFQPADAWNFAIGQGELTCTPLQAANVAATIAAGVWSPVRLAYDDAGQALGASLSPAAPFDEAAVRTLRGGMWRVVNDPGGTASSAKLEYPDYELCGKTGSAQTVPRVLTWRYICEWPDGRREEVVTPTEEDALATFGDEKPRIVGRRAADRYPVLLEGETLPAHAWFMGFVQPGTTLRGQPPTGRVYAISVVIEFGGSGGRVAAPVAKQIAEYLLEHER